MTTEGQAGDPNVVELAALRGRRGEDADLAERVAQLERRLAELERRAASRAGRDARMAGVLAETAATLRETRAALKRETRVVAEQQDPPAEARSSEGVRGKVATGLRWKLVSQVFSQGSRVLVGFILARLLTPEEFGLAALTLTFSALALVLSDPSLTARLVQRRDITEADRSTVFWATLAAGILCTAAGVALSWPIAAFYGDSALQPLLAVESVTFLLVSLSATHVALMTRAMTFRELELRDMVGTAVGGAVAVVAAFLGAGVWAIVAQSVVSACVATLLLWRFSSWRPGWIFSWNSLRDSGSFGLKLLASRLLSFLNLNADNLLVGRHLGSVALGFYSIAYNVMYAPLLRITAPIQNVMVPAFARLQDERERLGRAWLRGARLSAAVAMPAYLGMLAVAPDFVPVVLGNRWLDAVPVLQLLCISGILQGIQMLQSPLLQARGRAGSLLRYHLVATPVNIAGFAIGLQWGIVGVAAGFAVARALMVPVITRMTCREVGLPLSAFPRAVAQFVVGAACMCGLVIAARVGLEELGVPATARLAIVVALGAVAYAAYIALRAPDIVAELRNLRSG